MWERIQDVTGIVLGILYITGSFISLTINAIRQWAYDNPDIVYGVGGAAVACGVAALVMRAIWRRWLRDIVKPLYWKLIQRPMHRVLAPIRRLHRRWSERNMEKRMAKWKAGALADIVGDALLEANVIGVISDQEYRAYMQKAGKALGLSDLVRISNNKLAIAHRVKSNGEKMGLAAPDGTDGKHIPIKGTKSPIPGGKPGEDTVPNFKAIGEGLLARLKRSA